MTRDLDLTADMIDVRDIIARVEELRETATPWGAGFNMPGYMPDSDPGAFATWEEARDSLAEELTRTSDTAFESEEGAKLAEATDGALARLNALTEGEEFGETVGPYHYWLSRSHDVDADDVQELADLTALLADLAGTGGDEQFEGDWYPVTLIDDLYFKTYAQDLAEEIGAINADATWPNNCIDWDKAARELRMDYTCVAVAGRDYWTR